MTVKYADKDSIDKLIKFTGDRAKPETIQEAMKNADNKIRSKLNRYNIAEPDEKDVPGDLISAANYYAISDILQVIHLNNPKDRSANEEGILEKAESLICDYIQTIVNQRKEDEAKKKHPYRVSKGKSQIAKIFR